MIVLLERWWLEPVRKLALPAGSDRYVTEVKPRVNTCYVTCCAVVFTMVLSNAERQRRFRERRNQLAAVGITADMVDQVAMLIWEAGCRDDPTQMAWDELLASTGTKVGLENWRQHLEGIGAYPPDEADARERYGENAELVVRVTQVLNAAFIPPANR